MGAGLRRLLDTRLSRPDGADGTRMTQPKSNLDVLPCKEFARLWQQEFSRCAICDSPNVEWFGEDTLCGPCYRDKRSKERA